jgi:small subunit ribosomal protein S10
MSVNKNVKIKLKSYDHKSIDSSCEKIATIARKTGAKVVGPIPLPTKREVFTVLRAVHKFKTAREQFELRTHRRFIELENVSEETVGQLNKIALPSHVEIEIKL